LSSVCDPQAIDVMKRVGSLECRRWRWTATHTLSRRRDVACAMFSEFIKAGVTDLVIGFNIHISLLLRNTRLLSLRRSRRLVRANVLETSIGITRTNEELSAT
jgi:hypothetical protein